MDFGVLLIAVDEYPDPPGPLPSSESADRFADVLTGDYGGLVIGSIVARSQDEVIKAFKQWIARHEVTPLSTIVYLVGHGTDDGIDHSFLVPDGAVTGEIRTGDLASYFEKDWVRRQSDHAAWTLFVLDCCGADIGVTNLQNALTRVALKKPRRLSLWPTAPSGATHSGRFVAAFARALDTFTENDDVIRLNELFRLIRGELGGLEPEGYLPDEAALRNPRRTPTPVVMSLDAHAELRRAVAGLPPDVRNHFLAKAQGAEAGDLAWYFSGRQQEIASLSTWLRDVPTGMRVVTGEAGSGKSALLGHLYVLSDDELTSAYAASGLAPGLGAHVRPPSKCFDAAIQLTGRTLAQTVADLREQLHAPEDFLKSFRESGRTVTVLADALDEAQEPERIAEFLREQVASKVFRVVVGTRRSLGEGPDQPADPSKHELLDALDAGASDLLVVGRDREAIRDYVARRLSATGSPYASDTPAVEALAGKIAHADQPFLFARLLTSELLARPALDPESWTILSLLSSGHGGVFAAAIARLGDEDPSAVTMLAALALSRGRGVPESGGTWLAMGRAVDAQTQVPDTAVRTTIERAAPYLMLDGEGGQSVYRLAHRTFVEHFRRTSGWPLSHRLAGNALQTLVAHTGGWDVANYYLVRYLGEHFTADLEQAPPNVDALAALATDAGWLARAVALLGVDGVVDALASARRSLDILAVKIVERALRRSRIALGRDPGQLAAQIHARLHYLQDARLSLLGDRIGKHVDRPWLRLRNGALEWKADLETTYTAVGTVRALAFGKIDGEPVVAIGIDDQIRLWDPRRGQASERVIDNEGRRVTALAISHLNGTAVIVVASAYDAIAVIRDARTGAVVGPSLRVTSYVNSIALGRVGDEMAVAASGNGQLIVWNAQTGEQIDVPELTPNSVFGVSELNGRLVAHEVRAGGSEEGGAWVADIATGEKVFASPQRLRTTPSLVAGAPGPNGFVVAAASTIGSVNWWIADAATGAANVDKELLGVTVRGLAVGTVQGTPVAVYAPDYHGTALVSLRQLTATSQARADEQADDDGQREWNHAQIAAVFARPASAQDATPVIAVLVQSPFGVAPLADVTALDRKVDPATATFALTGTHAGVDFLIDKGNAIRQLPREIQLAENTALSLDKPRTWPRSARCYGVVGSRAVVATGSMAGVVWLWDAITGDVIGGPYIEISEARRKRMWRRRDLRMKTATTMVSSVTLGQHPEHGDVLAVAHDGSVRLVSLHSGKAIPTPAEAATVVGAVALGRLLGEETLVTGSQGGTVVVWGLASNSRIAALTIDSPVEKVWVVHGIDAIAVQTMIKGKRELFVLDVVAGSRD